MRNSDDDDHKSQKGQEVEVNLHEEKEDSGGVKILGGKG